MRGLPQTAIIMAGSIQKNALALLLLTLTGCGAGGPFGASNAGGGGSELRARPVSLSQADPLLTTCIFNPQTRIAYFPMYHFPYTGRATPEEREAVIKSQLQLLHTILTYSSLVNGIAVFDEHVTSNTFNPSTFSELERGRGRNFTYTRADGTQFSLQERYETAGILFGGGVPLRLNHLREDQKQFLFETGASMTLYYLGHIRHIHKVIEPGEYDTVMNQLQSGGAEPLIGADLSGNSQARNYWVFDYREEKLKMQVDSFFQENPGFPGIALIAYGASHNFEDDFQGYLFEKGACLAWDKSASPTMDAFL